MGFFAGLTALFFFLITVFFVPGLLVCHFCCGGADEKWQTGKKAFCALFSGILLQLAFPFFLHRLLLHNWNLFATCGRILRSDLTCQQVGRIMLFPAFGVLFALLIGACLKRVFTAWGHRPPDRRKTVLFLAVSGSVLIAAAGEAVCEAGASDIVINEVCGNNRLWVEAETGESPDYVELYNAGALPYELSRFSLSDDETDLSKASLSGVTIPAKGYALIPLHPQAFSVKKTGGETIFLSDASKKIWDRITVPAMEADFSYARTTDGGADWAVLSSTPNCSNATASPFLAAPVFSHKSGFYETGFELTIRSEPDTEIYYTLDGSVPTTQSILYTGPIRVTDRSSEPNQFRNIRNVTTDWLTQDTNGEPVDKAFLIRAVAVNGQGSASRPVSATYLIGLDQYRDRAVVSLIADPDDLWGDDGIYVTGAEYDDWYLNGQEGEQPLENFYRRGREYEIPAYFEFFSDDLSFSQDVGLRVAGSSARGAALKRFSVYARKAYAGSSVFDRDFFRGINSHKIVLRGEYDFANSVCPQLVTDRDVAVQSYLPVSVFLNGEFWYHTSLQENYDKYYFQQRYQIAPDNIVLLKENSLEEGEDADLLLWQNIYDYLASHDMSLSDSYRGFGEIVDLQSYIDYMCINVYFDNMDFSETKNNVMWRSREVGPGKYEDGKWRFALYDLDAMSFNDYEDWGLSSQQEKDSFSLTPKFTGGVAINQQAIYQLLKQNPEFCRQFVLTFMDLVNTDFRYEKCEPILYAYGRTDISYYTDFFQNRAAYIVPCLAKEFGLEGTQETVSLSVDDPEGGYLVLNTITPELSENTWSGSYFTDYPVTVTAVARQGYEFAGWEGTVFSSEEQIEVPVEKGGIRLHASFQKVG